MHPDLERRELLGTALNLVPGFHILKDLPGHEQVQQGQETPEDISATDLLIMANTENWFAKHAEHCLKRISLSGPISNWSEQLHQHLHRFEQSANGEDGGPGILITRVQMELLSWQTRASTGAALCQTRLFVATMFLIDMTVSCLDAYDQSGNTKFAVALKSKHPALYEALADALRVLNSDEVLGMVDTCSEMSDFSGDEQTLCREHRYVTAPGIRECICSLLNDVFANQGRRWSMKSAKDVAVLYDRRATHACAMRRAKRHATS